MALKNLSICALEIERTSIKIGLKPRTPLHWMSIMRFMQKYLHGHPYCLLAVLSVVLQGIYFMEFVSKLPNKAIC